MSAAEIEKRLNAVEQDVARLKSAVASAPQFHPVQAMERIHGTFENDNAFLEAMRLGRNWRRNQRPPAERRASKAKRP